jgi:regulatory protein
LSPRPVSLKGRALRMLSRREHTRTELERKLGPHETQAGELAQVLDDLQAKGFISEARVVESLVNQRAARFGLARLRQEMQQKGVSDEAQQEALATLKASEPERARLVWEKKFGAPPQTDQERARQIRYLMSRGFAAEVVRKLVRA